jgi:hypothetical protein
MIDVLVHPKDEGQVFLYGKDVVTVYVVSESKFDKTMQRVSYELYVIMSGFDNKISKGEKADDEIVKFIVLYHEIIKICSCYFIRSVTHLLYFFQLCAIIVLLL